MFSALEELAIEVGRAEAKIGPTVSSVPTLRPYGSSPITGKASPAQGADAQLDSFRGVIYAATDKIGRRIAQLPINLALDEVRGEERTHKPIMIHPFLRLWGMDNNYKPHPEFNTWELKYTVSTSLDVTGESWILVERDEFGVPSRLTPLPTSRMTIVFDEDTGEVAGHYFCPKGTTPETGGIYIPKLSWSELQRLKYAPFIWYARYPSPRGIEDTRGWSPIKSAAYAYDINLFELIYKRNFLQQGAQLGGILQSETSLSKEQITEYLDQFKARHSGLKHAGLPMILPKMLKWTTTEPTPRDLQWVDAVKLTESQILQTYGISDAKLGRADIGNRNTADAMDVTFNREVIQSRLDLISAAFNSDFIPIYPQQTDRRYFCCKFDDPVPADSEQNMKRERQDLEMNVITRNEVREGRGRKAFGAAGERLWFPINHYPVDPTASDVQPHKKSESKKPDDSKQGKEDSGSNAS